MTLLSETLSSRIILKQNHLSSIQLHETRLSKVYSNLIFYSLRVAITVTTNSSKRMIVYQDRTILSGNKIVKNVTLQIYEKSQP